MGLQGENLYFTPKDGGECWRCPDGYRRTWKAIHKEESCKERGLGFNKDKVDATFVRSAYGCEEGQFEKGGECYRCPTGSSKVSFLWAFNPGASISVPLGVADVGSGAWFSYYPIRYLGLSFSASGGIGLETVNYNQAVTMLY